MLAAPNLSPRTCLLHEIAIVFVVVWYERAKGYLRESRGVEANACDPFLVCVELGCLEGELKGVRREIQVIFDYDNVLKLI